jgi:Pyruvate/2-oxoacid:ferredoxin oxidoreductase gamma subunit
LTKASLIAHNNEHRKRGKGIKERKKEKRRGGGGRESECDRIKALAQGKVIDKNLKLLQMAMEMFKKAWETLQTLFW